MACRALSASHSARCVIAWSGWRSGSSRAASPSNQSGSGGCNGCNHRSDAWAGRSIVLPFPRPHRRSSASDEFLAQLNPAGNARGFKQLIDQMLQSRDLTLNDARRLALDRVFVRCWTRSDCAALENGASGLRSSCESIARNSSLLRSASRSSCSAGAQRLLALAQGSLLRARVFPLPCGARSEP
jgi:hypothetical protein